MMSKKKEDFFFFLNMIRTSMHLYVMLNYVMHRVECPRYYLPLILIDLREHGLMCDRINSLTLLMKNPRPNIDLISCVFDFYFPASPAIGTECGEVHARHRIIYNIDRPMESEEHRLCVLFLEGRMLREILLYMPHPPGHYLRQLMYHHFPRRDGACIVCCEEETVLINLHGNEFEHEVCETCLLRVNQCPICRSIL